MGDIGILKMKLNVSEHRCEELSKELEDTKDLLRLAETKYNMERETKEKIDKNQSLLYKAKNDLQEKVAQLTDDNASLKETLEATKQTLRAVQEDRDEFAAKMNDAVERADQLQARCGDLERQVTSLQNEQKSHLAQVCTMKGEISAFRFVVEHWRGGGT